MTVGTGTSGSLPRMPESSDRPNARPGGRGAGDRKGRGPARPPAKDPRRGPGGARGQGGQAGRGGPSRGSRSGRPAGRGGPERSAAEDAAPRTWGSLARKGARRLDEDRRGAGTAPPSRDRPDEWTPEEWVDEGPVRRAAKGAVDRGASARRAPRPDQDIDVSVADAARAVGPARAERVEKRLREAAAAFERERFAEARKILAPLADQAPASVAVRELHGLTLYRLGRWKAAAAELEVFRELSGSTEQHPVLADCYRALRRFTDVGELWEELRAASPSAELVTEGRIVAAGALADQGDLEAAIALLERSFRLPKRPQVHHLRRTYALADLYERVGDVPRARSLFERIATVDPEFADVDDRCRALD